MHSHIISIGDLSLLVSNDWEAQFTSRDLINIFDPSTMALDRVCRETNQLDTTLGELWLELSEGAQLGGADGRVVFWVGEENDPVVADELVKVNWTRGGFGLEVWGDGAETETVMKQLVSLVLNLL